uniref:Uncharacterized protein n=1 Tax=uncultured gamma proteobacterium HF0070_08D07 TaxID=710983 RepID=E0XRW8_9GAMM|nr:hypothetical protein [uncultured gamma proteobacterium HF0070_08D07]
MSSVEKPLQIAFLRSSISRNFIRAYQQGKDLLISTNSSLEII